jgi:hypothetical protein
LATKVVASLEHSGVETGSQSKLRGDEAARPGPDDGDPSGFTQLHPTNVNPLLPSTSPTSARPAPGYWFVDFDAVADELFALAPAAFIERRNSLAAAARSEDDEQLAARIKALRRPTVGAALVNAFVRERGEAFASFLALGAELRDAQARGDGQQMRALAARRQQLMRDLDGDVAELAEERGLTATRAVQQDVHATMLAALSDPRAAAIVQTGRLESALTGSAFADGAPVATGGRTSANHSGAESVDPRSTGRLESAERKLNEANTSADAADHTVEKLAAAVSSAQRELADLENRLEEALERARAIERDRSAASRNLANVQDAHTDATTQAKALREAAVKARSTYERERADSAPAT